MFNNYIEIFSRDPIPCIAVFVTLLPIALIIVRKAYIDPTFRLLFFYLLFKFVIDILMFHFASRHENNLVYFNVSIPVYYSLLAGMFYFKFTSSKFKKGIIVSMFVFTFLVVLDILNSNDKITDLHNHRAVIFVKTIEGVLIIILTLLYFYEIIKSLKIQNLLTFPFFWVCSGLLLYYSSFIFIAPFLHYTATWNHMINLGITEMIPYTFEIFCALLFSIGIYHFSAQTYARQ